MDKLNDIVRQFGLELSEKQLQQFSRYYDILVEWNSFMNLTAITDRDDVIIKHFADSLLLYKYKDLHDNLSVLDVGTGAGFPGIPFPSVIFQVLLVQGYPITKPTHFQ